jgi:hypothetical protein
LGRKKPTPLERGHAACLLRFAILATVVPLQPVALWIVFHDSAVIMLADPSVALGIFRAALVLALGPCFEVDVQFIFGRPLHWQVGRLLSLEDALDYRRLRGRFNVLISACRRTGRSERDAPVPPRPHLPSASSPP